MLQVVEQACSVTNLLLGENLQGVSKDMDLTCHRLGMYEKMFNVN